jgi:GT2 family glycosyltransferase
MPSISIIIPTLNNLTLDKTLESLVNQVSNEDEILVVGLDEAGITKRFTKVRFISTHRPASAAAARNIGIKEAKGDIFLFTDSDCIPSSQWVETHRQYQMEGNLVAGGGVNIESINFWTLSDNLSMFHEFTSNQPAGEKFLLPTLNLSVNRKVWLDIGGFDESFLKAGGEDSDWALRMKRAGYKLQFFPSATVTHSPSRTNWQDLFEHWHQSGQNNIKVRIKYSEEFGSPFWIRNSFALKVLSPFIAAWATFKIYSTLRFWRYLACMPVVYFTKLTYCWGAAQTIKSCTFSICRD